MSAADDRGPATGERHSRWVEVEALFQEALSQGPETRREFLAERCPDAEAIAEVEALLAAHEKRGPLDDLVDEVMSPLLEARPRPAQPGLPQHSRYRVLERLGGGGMGVVYRARDERLGRDVALKFLSAGLSADPAAKRRFLVEARAAAALEHPNICTVHEIGDADDGQLYIVMACYEGETLDRKIARGPLPLDEALRIAGDIARGLQKAHERGIVHCDIKPANVMCTADGIVKILDFGIARLSDVAVTQNVGAVGTLFYMSPEQAMAEAMDHRSDLWSLGVVLYEMLAGVRPFTATSALAMVTAITVDDPPPISLYRPDLPAGVDALLRRLLAKPVAERVSSAEELQASLVALAALPSREGGAARGGPATKLRPVRDSALTKGGERRQTVVLRADLDGADALLQRLAPQEAELLFERLRTAAQEIAQAQGGLLNRADSDGFTFVFGVPTAQEDDARRSLRAAVAFAARATDIIATQAPSLAGRVQLRSGVHVGAAIVQRLPGAERRHRITGAPMEVALRLAAAAAPGAVLASGDLLRLVPQGVTQREVEPLTLPGHEQPIAVHEVTAVGAAVTRAAPSEDRGRAFVGRERECATLGEHLASAESGVGRVVVLVAEAGAGKSRLLDEMRRRGAERAMRVLSGRCDAYGATTPFLPFVDAVHEALAVPSGGSVEERHEAALRGVRALDASLEGSLPLFLGLLGIPSESHPLPQDLRGELFQAAMLEAIAALFTLAAVQHPTLLLLEDWHWADEASRAALRQLGEIAGAFPLCIAVTARPEGAMELATDEHVSLLHLSPLDRSSSEWIARAVLRADRVAPELSQWLHERTGGNPFFLEEVCEDLVESQAVRLVEGEAQADRAMVLAVPGTVQGVLRTRMDRLDDESRDTLRVAAVVGREFTRGVLEDVVEYADALVASLERLKSSGLVQQVAVVPEPAYRFKHVLTQEVAYDSLLEHQRTMLHAAVGRAIETRYAAQLDKHVERLAHHFGRAEEWEAAVRYGLQAADRAMALCENADVMSLLERAESWAQRVPDEPLRRDLLADVLLRTERLCETLGLRTRQLALVESLIALLAPHGPSMRLAQAYLRQGDALTLLRRFEAAERSLLTARQIAEELDEPSGERNALRSLSFLRSHEGRHDEALAIIEEVVASARAAGDRRAEHGDLASIANILRALGRPEQARDVLQEAIDRTDHAVNPARYGALLNVMATLHRDLGDLPAALEYYQRTRSYVPHTVYASFSLPGIAYLQLQQGETEAAIATYREAVEMNRRARYADGTANASRSLGEVLMGLERYDEALLPLHDAAALFAQLEDVANEALMRRRIAEVEERRGASAEARRAWRAAADRALAAGDRRAEADALEGIARCERRLDGPTAGVVALYEDALRIATQLGDRRRELSLRNALGIVHWQRGAFAEAVRQYEAALRLCREGSDRVHEGLILNSLGATLLKLKRWDEARLALADGVRVTEASGEVQLRAHALGLLGEVCLASGRFDEAQRALESSLQLRLVLGDRRGEGWMLEHLSRVALARADVAAARVHARDALSIAESLDDAALRSAAQQALAR